MDTVKIVTIVVLAVMIGLVVIRKLSTDKGREELKKFFNTLIDAFEKILINHIIAIDFNNLANLAGLEKTIIGETIGSLWDITTTELASYATNPLTKALIKQCLTKENVEAFAEQVFKDAKVQQVYTSKYNEAVITGVSKARKFEAAVAAENKSYADGTAETLSVPDLDPNKKYTSESLTTPDQKLVEKTIIPQHEEEQAIVDKNDTSQEIIGEPVG